jgi:hypothetical protein
MRRKWQLHLLARRRRVAGDAKQMCSSMVVPKGLYRRAEGAVSNATNRTDFLAYRPRKGACKRMTTKAIDLLGVTRKQGSTQRVQVGEQPAPSECFVVIYVLVLIK